MASKKVLLVGGSGGIGTGIVMALLESDYEVVVTYNKNPNRIKDSLGVKKIKFDMLNQKDIDEFVVDEYSAIIFAAGQESNVALKDAHINDITNQLMIDSFTPLQIIQKAIQRAETQCLECIIFISSLAGNITCSEGGLYSFSKASVFALSRLLSRELKYKQIRVNAIAPGWCETPMASRVLAFRGSTLEEEKYKKIDQRLISPAEIGAMCVFLLSQEAKHVTGQVVEVESL